MTDDCHILVVEDDPRLRERLARYLTGEGFRVTAAADAAEARTQLRAIAPDLMVLDVMMPGESGLELTQSLRAERRGDLPILLLTARGAPEDRIAGFEAGADDYLGKPFEPRELVLRIRAMLRRAPAPAAPDVVSGPVRIGEAEFDVQCRRSGVGGAWAWPSASSGAAFHRTKSGDHRVGPAGDPADHQAIAGPQG